MAGIHEYIYKLQSVRPGKVSLAEVFSFYSTFAGAFVLIMQTDEGSPPPSRGATGGPLPPGRGIEDNEEHNLGKKSH